MIRRLGSLTIALLFAGFGAPTWGQALDCTLPQICIWADDDTCGRCIDEAGTGRTTTTCIVDAECAGVGGGFCSGVCADDLVTPCLDHAECTGGVCKFPSAGLGTQADPRCRIQQAYDGAAQTTTPDNIHTVVVLPGTYQECITAWGFVEDANGLWDETLSDDDPVYLVAKDFLDNGDNTSTVIDGTGKCDDTVSVNERDSAVKLGGTGATLEGFTITGGARSGVFAQGDVTITNNVITGNESELGGGVYLLTAGCYYGVNVTAEITNNVITNNRAAAPNGIVVPECALCLSPLQPCGGGDGGGIFAAVTSVADSDCSTTDRLEIRGNEISDNIAENFNGDPCTSICENSPDLDNPIICGIPPDPSCPPGTEPCVPQIAYTSNGGGIFAFTASEQDEEASVTITENLISGNAITATPQFAEGYGGGIYAVTFGIGVDTVAIADNCIGGADLATCTGSAGSGNSATLHGGGVSARARPFVAGLHEVDILDNRVTANSAEADGGGFELLTEATYLGSGLPSNHGVRLTASGNEVIDNFAGLDGGGIKATADIRRTTRANAEVLELSIDGNVIQDNTSGLGAGGVLLIPIADADDFSGGVCGPDASPAETRIDFARNLVIDNVATADDPTVDVIGGGILVLPLTFGDASTEVVIDRTTVAGNSIGPEGIVAGIESEAVTYYGCLPGNTDLGHNRLVLDRTIVANNTCPPATAQCIGVGGPPMDPGDPTLEAAAASSVVFGHDVNYEGSLFAVVPPPENLTSNPQLAAGTYFPAACSPVFAGFCHGNVDASCDVDANCGTSFCSADTDDGFALASCTSDGECPGGSCLQRCVDAVGFYANPDTTGDGAIDGQEVLAIAASFGAEEGVDNRFDPAADLNNNGENDGVDLAFFTTQFGAVCEP